MAVLRVIIVIQLFKTRNTYKNLRYVALIYDTILFIYRGLNRNHLLGLKT